MTKTSGIFYLKRKKKLIFSFVLALQLWSSGEMKAQLPTSQVEVQEPEEHEWPEDMLERRTPRGTVAGYISAVANKDYEKAGEYFKSPKAEAPTLSQAELARQLEMLLDYSGEMMPYSWLSQNVEGRLDDDLPNHLERVGSITTTNETFDLLIEKVEDPEGGPMWLFSDQTIGFIQELGDSEGQILLVNRFMPDILERHELWGASLGQWLALFLLAAFSYALAWLIIHFFLFIIPLVWKKARTEPTAGVFTAFALPVKLYLSVWFFVMLSQEIGISIILRQRFSGITTVIGILALLILLWRLSEFLGTFSTNRMTSRGNISGVSVVLFLKRAVKILIIAFGIIAVLGAVGVDITTGLAALGLGGLALALGAQKTIENFVGSVSVITDQPVRVGDYCKIGNTTGVVENIGMRSTRIRTLDRTVITIPNGHFSSSTIENYALRDQFWFHPTIALRYETTPDQIRYLLVELRAILYAHPMVTSDPARVRFVNLGADSIDLEVFTYIKVATFDEFLEVKEDLLLRIMDVVRDSGTGFAFPTQTIYLGKDNGLSEEKSKRAEEKVRSWRQNGDLQLPSFDPERIKELENKTPYPPEGSAVPKKGV